MRQTYEFALEHIGMDYHATPLWSEYIGFMKAEYVIILRFNGLHVNCMQECISRNYN